MERKTIEVILPDSKAKVYLYEQFTHGDYMQIQRKIVEGMKIDPNKAEGQNISEIDAAVAIDMNQMALKLLVKQIILEEGEVVNDTDSFIYNCTVKDGALLTEKATAAYQGSQLSSDSKKK